MKTLTSLSFDLQPGGTTQCNFRYDDGSLSSFDEAQLPELMKGILGELVIVQTAKIEQQTKDLETANATIQQSQAYVSALEGHLADAQALAVTTKEQTDAALAAAQEQVATLTAQVAALTHVETPETSN